MLYSFFRAEENVRGVDIMKDRRMQATVRGIADLFAQGTPGAKTGARSRRRS
jgi:hypothetical protein